jgi:TIR domain.
VGSNLPKNWIKARSKLQDIHKNFIPLEQYLDICDENNIRELPDKLQLSSYLHDIGAQIHFQDDPLLRKTIILNPKWATRAIYSILDNQVITKQKGRFSIDQAKAIWSIQDYEGMQDELVQLMLKFKLCYKIRLTDSFIAPQLLPINPPYYEWDHHDNLILKIKYDYMPKGLLSNLIVALHIYITREDLVWRNGAVFVRDKTSAEVITCKDDNEIRIRLHGIFKKDLLSIILYEIDNIHLNFSEIKHDKFVPCNCSTCASTLEPHFYPLSKLNEFIENNKFEIQCYKPPYQMVSILPMIDDIFKSEGRKSLSESQNSFFYKDEISTNAQEVFVSYAWGGESETLANNLEDYLRTKGIFVIRDKNEIRYKQSINDFMRRMGHGKCVVIVISKKYLESENCMLELLLLLQNNDFRDRLFPIVLPDSKIHDAISRIHYIQYWEDKSKMLKETLSKISPEYMSATHETLNLYCDIRRSIDQISSFLSDMKALDFDTVTNPDLEQLYLALKTRLDIV